MGHGDSKNMHQVKSYLLGPDLGGCGNRYSSRKRPMAKDIGISTSYLNLIERNQRPMSAKVLLRIVDVFDIDVSVLSPKSDMRMVARNQ